MKLKTIAAAATAAAAMIALAGCSTPSGPAEDQTLTIVAFATDAESDARVQFVADAFEEANPGVTVDVTVVPGDGNYDTLIRSQIQSGSAPDLFEVLGDPTPYIEAGLLENLDDQAWVERQVEGVRQAAEAAGGTYYFTGELNALGVVYNKTLFAEAGVEVPTTWDEFTAAIAAFKSQGIVPLATGAKDGWPLPLAIQAMVIQDDELAAGSGTAGELKAGELAFSESSAWSDALDAYAGLVADGSFDANATGIDWPSSAAQMANGQAAMMIQGTFAFGTIRSVVEDVDLGMFPMPYGDPVVGFGVGARLAMPTAGNTELAKQFLEFYATPEIMAEWVTRGTSISPFVDVESAVDPAADELIAAIIASSADYTEAAGLNAATAAVLAPGLQAIMAGNGTAGDLLSQLDAAQQ